MSGPTRLGMPAVRPSTADPTWKSAWDAALYGPEGFFRRESPAAHFRTSVHASPRFAEAVLELVRRAGLDTVVDVGAGRGELLGQLHALDPSLELLGVEVAPRPAELPGAVAWTHALPASVEGLVIANEWLDDVPCHVVEVGEDGRARVVHVDPATGRESPGSALTDAGVPPSLREWCERWWPLEDAKPGARAEVGTSRDAAWAEVVGRLSRGLAIAVDYGHLRGERPVLGSLRSYRDGHEVEVLPDGSRDVTAPVAVDAVAARVGAEVLTQREALLALGVSATRPPLQEADDDPQGYLRRLSRSTEAAELLEPTGLGGFFWVVNRVGVPDPFRRPAAPPSGAGAGEQTG